MGIGSVFSNVINPTNLAMLAAGPAGWASLAVKTLMSSIGQEIIQQIGSQLGLPQSTIDLAQGAFAASMGDTQGVQQNLQEAMQGVGDAFDFTPTQQGEFEGNVTDSLNDMAMQGMRDAEKASGGEGGEGGWLMAMAKALGSELNDMASEMESMANKISKDTPDITTKFSALSQQFSILFNAASTAIKAVGEGMAQTARKQ